MKIIKLFKRLVEMRHKLNHLQNDLNAMDAYVNSLPDHDKKYIATWLTNAKSIVAEIIDVLERLEDV